MQIIIVESPTKANTFKKYLPKEYNIIATYGHIRDLAKSKISIELENNYKPNYITPKAKQKIVTSLKKGVKNAKKIYLATDSDREGEAIAYHVAYQLGYVKEKWPNAEIKDESCISRISFHEITKKAILEALENPQDIKMPLVDSQQSRRILDRIVGYKLSPLLWKKTGKRWLSAGRVQTVALRIINEREKEIKLFKSTEFIEIIGDFESNFQIKAKLISKDNVPYEKTKVLNLFAGDYKYTDSIINKTNIEEIEKDLLTDIYKVSLLDSRIVKSQPPPPYTTSLLQQDCSRILGLSSKATMSIAQRLYERGIITYHRTDSFNMSKDFINKIRDFILSNYGENLLSDKPRIYKTKSMSAQEAHECIRPTSLKTAQDFNLDKRESQVYSLILKRSIATQMQESKTEVIKLQIKGYKGYLFSSTYENIVSKGFKILYDSKEKLNTMPGKIKVNDKVSLLKINRNIRETQSPPRYNEASLIKLLEERGIGRPSTYAPIISLIQERKYVEKIDKRFYPTLLGSSVCDYLAEKFNSLFSIDYTSGMENQLDQIAEGKLEIVKMLDSFYKPFSKLLEEESASDTYIKIQEDVGEDCPLCKNKLVYRYSKYGKFISCSGYPECKFSKSYVEKANKKCPKCGNDIIIKYTKRKRKFYGCSNYPNCDFATWKLT